jgi:Ger(x)C family germination protein
MMDVINLPGAFIERQEALMFGFWIITAFAVGNAMLFFGGIIVRDVVKGTGLRTGVAITTVAVFAISIVPFSREEIYARIDYMYMTTGLFFVIVLPIILIIASKITIWGGEKTKKKLARTSTMILIPLLSMALLSGCWDKVEIENRAFVVAMGIDKGENENYAITLSIPILNKEDEDEKPAHVNTAEGETLLAALKKLDAKNDKNLYYGQTKLVVLGTEILENKELLEAAINTLEDKLEATRRIHVVAAKSPEKILATKPPGEILPGSYIPNMYRDKDKIGGASFTLDFERLSTKSSKVAIVPKIEAEEDELKLSGAAVLENSKKTGLLSPEELQGYLWAFCGGNQGAVITAENNSSLAVEKHKTQITFRSAKPAPRVTIDVHVTGKLYGNHPANFETIIAQELSQTAHLLQTTHQTDGYNWLQLLRKKNYPLYKKHAENWDEIFPKLEIIPRVTVEIL